MVAHLEHAGLVGRAEPVLDRADGPVGALALALRTGARSRPDARARAGRPAPRPWSRGPTSSTAIRSALATRMISPATSRTWATEPAALDSSALWSVWTESITHTSGRSASSVASTVWRSVSAITGISSAAVSLSRSARSRIWAADSSADTYRVRRPAATRLASAIVVSVDLPIPGAPPISTSDPGTIPPPRTLSSSPMPVLSAIVFVGGDAPQRHRRDGGDPRASPARTRGAGRPGPHLLDQRVPLAAARDTARPTAASRGRTPSRRESRWDVPSAERYAPAPTASRPASLS